MTAPAGRTIRRVVADQRSYYMMIAARVFTRWIREDLSDSGYVGWSAPATVEPGDLLLLYEMAKPASNGDTKGRKQIGWIMRARTAAQSDPRRPRAADFDVYPLRRPLPLAEAKKVRRFATGPGRTLQGSVRRLDAKTFEALFARIVASNPELDGALASPRKLSQLFAHAVAKEATEDDENTSFSASGRGWHSERLLQDDCADAIERERWALPVSTDEAAELGLGDLGLHGFYYPRQQWFIDDLLWLDPADRHLVVVEYELAALGTPRDGARQAADYRDALRRDLRSHGISAVDALVIAESFNEAEFQAADVLNVECLRAQTTGHHRRRRISLHDAGRVSGPVAACRKRVRGRSR